MYAAIQKKSPVSELFRQNLPQTEQEWFSLCSVTLRQLRLFQLDDSNWVSLFKAADTLLTYYNALVTTQQQGISSGVIQSQNPLFAIDISESWKNDLQQMMVLFRSIVDCTDPTNTSHLNPYIVYLALIQCINSTKTSSLSSDAIMHIDTHIDQCVQKYFNMELLCLYHYFARGNDDGSIATECNDELFPKNALEGIVQRFYCGQNWEVCTSELDEYMKKREKMGGVTLPYSWWLEEGKLCYPELSKVVLAIIAFPHNEDSLDMYGSMKSCIHYRLRSKKDNEAVAAKVNEEMMLSCNRHLLIRWNLDFQ